MSELKFWNEFVGDLNCAKCRVLIQSPFLSPRRIDGLRSVLTRLINSGITVCVVVQEPMFWTANQSKLWQETAKKNEELKLLITQLESMRIHVNLKPKIHAKMAVIDDFALWEGSLNFLSHVDTKERMRRFTDRKEIEEALLQIDECSVCLENEKLVLKEYSPLELRSIIQRHRRRTGETMQELAVRSDITPGWLSKVQRHERNLSLSVLSKLAENMDLVPIMVPKQLFPSVSRLIRESLGRD